MSPESLLTFDFEWTITLRGLCAFAAPLFFWGWVSVLCLRPTNIFLGGHSVSHGCLPFECQGLFLRNIDQLQSLTNSLLLSEQTGMRMNDLQLTTPSSASPLALSGETFAPHLKWRMRVVAVKHFQPTINSGVKTVQLFPFVSNTVWRWRERRYGAVLEQGGPVSTSYMIFRGAQREGHTSGWRWLSKQIYVRTKTSQRLEC